MANKPWLKQKDEKVIEVEGCKLTVQRISFGDSRKAIHQAFKFNPVTKDSEVDPTLLGVLRAIYQIKDWDLTDENDNKLPITLDTFDNLLDEDFVGKVIDAVSKAFPQGVPEDKKKN